MTGVCLESEYTPETEGVVTAFAFSELTDTGYVVIGTYKTLERAKEVLREITYSYADNVFYMPKE